MKLVICLASVILAAVGAGPSVMTGNVNQLRGGCTANATSTSQTDCKPDTMVCEELEYSACHTTAELALDIECVDDQLNDPCQSAQFNCGSKKDADYDTCD